MNFTIAQLILAEELCFPADFERLTAKHCKGTKWEGVEVCWRMDFKHRCESRLMRFIFSHSRADLERGCGEIIDKILFDLINGVR